MVTTASSKRQVLAKFIDDVPPNKGWWFCLPTLATGDANLQLAHPTDACMPHLGVPFGMTEVVMVKILLSMECLRLQRGKSYMNVKGWEDLRGEFKVTAIEWGVSRLKRSSGPTWYIQLGENKYIPSKLYSRWKQGILVPPSIIGQRKATKFIQEELRRILLSVEIQDGILTYSQSRKDTRSEAEANSEEGGEEDTESDTPESENEESKEETQEEVVAGGIPPAEDYPFLNKYGISILNNSLVLNGLLNELTKLVSCKGSIE
jgi:hypothetical protein